MPQVQEEEVADEIAVDLIEMKVVRDGGDVEVLWLLFGRVVVRCDAPVPDLVGFAGGDCTGRDPIIK